MVEAQDGIENIVDESANYPVGPANTANGAFKNAVQRYLNAAGVNIDLAHFEQRVRERALFSLGLAASVGFVLGGGVATRLGSKLLEMFASKAVGQKIANVG